jgi:MFS family permease
MLMRTGTQRRPAGTRDERTPTGINLGVGAVAVVVAAVLAAALPDGNLWWRLGAMTVLVAAFAAVTDDQPALAGVALMAWFVSNGFLENHLGELSWHGSTDLGLAMVLVIAGAVGLTVGQGCRLVLGWRARYPVAEDVSGPVLDVDEKERLDG